MPLKHTLEFYFYTQNPRQKLNYIYIYIYFDQIHLTIFIVAEHNQKYKHNLITIHKLSTINYKIIEP